MKTYNERIEELNKRRVARVEVMEGLKWTNIRILYDVIKNRLEAKIEQLNELRAEAIEKVKKIEQEQLVYYEKFKETKDEKYNKWVNDAQVIIDYLKSEWSIEWKDLNE